jgi:hypothetical protein
MALADDEWVQKFSPIESEKLHALGLITFMWNACEYKLFEMFHLVYGITPEFAWVLVHDLGDISISNRITAFLEKIVPNPKAVERQSEVIQNALKAYDICRQNRNQFTHFSLEHDLKAMKVHMLRQQKGPHLERIPFPTDISDMRRVAQEIVGLNGQIDAINKHLRTYGADQPAPLPDIVVLPEYLWKPAPQNEPAPQPLRPPSALRLTEEEWLAKYRKEGRSLPQAE